TRRDNSVMPKRTQNKEAVLRARRNGSQTQVSATRSWQQRSSPEKPLPDRPVPRIRYPTACIAMRPANNEATNLGLLSLANPTVRDGRIPSAVTGGFIDRKSVV